MLQRTPWSPKLKPKVVLRSNPKVPWKLSRQQHRALIEMLLPFMLDAEPTAFAEEAPRRYKLRSKLCLEGWPWNYADQEAAAVTHEALRRIGARRPSWGEGQQEYCHEGYLRDDNCWFCGEVLPKYRKKYCCNRHAMIASKLRPRNMFDIAI